MEILLGSILVTLLIHTICFLVFEIFMKQKVQLYGVQRYVFHAVISLTFSFLLICGLANLLNSVSTVQGNIVVRYHFAFILIALLCCTFSICSYMSAGSGNVKDKANIYQVMKACCVGVATVLLSEIFIFNYLSFAPMLMNLNKGTLLLDNADFDGDAARSGDAILIGEKGGSVSFANVNQQSSCFRIKGSQNHKLCNVAVELSDENFTAQTYGSGSYDFCVDSERTTVLPVYSTGKMKRVKFTFNSACAGLRIEQISINQPDFFFSYFRFFVLVAVVLAFILIKRKKLWQILYNPQSLSQNLSIALLIAVLCSISVFIGKIPYQNADIAYPLEKSPENYGCYIQQFDAFQKGQLNLDIPVDAKLAAMKNPYDTSIRSAKEVPYAWDRAYYIGKYYSYFGVAPVFTVYYPYYLLTGSLPYDFKAAALLSLFAIPFIVLLIRELVCYFCKKVNLLLLLLGMAAAVFSSLLYTLQVSADFYYIPYLSAMTFLSLFLFLAFRAVAAPNIRKRAGLLALSGASYVLAVGSRPISAIFILVVLPVFLKMILGKKTLNRIKIGQICAFGIPVLIGALLLMKYNYDRFASPFEFGINYQLTIDNTKYNKVSLLTIIPAIYHYFFQFPSIDAQFPFIHVVDKQLNYYAGCKLHIVMLGAMSFPLLWSVFGVRHIPSYKASRVNKATYLAMLLPCVVIAILNFSMSGTDIRYITDFTLVLSSLAVLIILDFDSQYDCIGDPNRFALGLRKLTYSVSVIAMCASILVGMAAIFSNETNRILNFAPDIYASIERLCMFW